MGNSNRLTFDSLEEIIGPSDREVAEAIIATGASAAEVEEALQYAIGQDDVMGEMRIPLRGRAQAVYDILIADEYGEER